MHHPASKFAQIIEVHHYPARNPRTDFSQSLAFLIYQHFPSSFCRPRHCPRGHASRDNSNTSLRDFGMHSCNLAHPSNQD